MEFIGYRRDIDVLYYDNMFVTTIENGIVSIVCGNTNYYGISVSGFNNVYAFFADEKVISKCELLTFATKFRQFVKQTLGLPQTSINHREIKQICKDSLLCENVSVDYCENNECSIPICIKSGNDGKSWHIVSNTTILYSLNNLNAAKRIFQHIKKDVLSHIYKRWPIK